VETERGFSWVCGTSGGRSGRPGTPDGMGTRSLAPLGNSRVAAAASAALAEALHSTRTAKACCLNEVFTGRAGYNDFAS
jgi:hypothetical protein